MPGAPGRILGTGSEVMHSREDAVRLFALASFEFFLASDTCCTMLEMTIGIP
jgi:hypothetical protein